MTWRERIVAARERGAFTREDVCLSGEWKTCAVGEQRAHLPHVVIYNNCFGLELGFPVDEQLQFLGSDVDHGFPRQILLGNMDAAESLLDQIEDRVLELKRNV